MKKETINKLYTLMILITIITINIIPLLIIKYGMNQRIPLLANLWIFTVGMIFFTGLSIGFSKMYYHGVKELLQ